MSVIAVGACVVGSLAFADVMFRVAARKQERVWKEAGRDFGLHYYRPKNIRYPTIEYFDSQINEEVLIEETNNYDSDKEVNQLTWYYSSKTKKDFLINTFTTRMYWPDTMNQLLIEAGFEILNIWGDYNLKPFCEESSLQIFELKIRAT